MQVKIIIGTVAFMLTMILMGFYTLLEPSRMEGFTGARHGRQVEAGAALFYANCTNCHGEEGKAEACFDPATKEPITCLGLPLNSYGLVCGDLSQRMDARKWSGTKASFIRETIAGGRAGGVMPVWGLEYGGPLQANQVENLTQFVLNYEDNNPEGLCDVVPYAFPWPAAHAELFTVGEDAIVLEAGQEFDLTNLPILPGNPDRGKTLYAETYPCTTCHGVPEDPTTEIASGPWHGDYATVVQTRIGEQSEDGLVYESALDYTYRSILYPNEYLVTDYAAAMPVFSQDGTMNANPQDLADLIAYLLQER